MRLRPIRPPTRSRALAFPAAAVLVAALVVAGLPGCVQRRFVIRSDPPGALVSLEDEPVSVPTPVEIPFEFDGVRRVTLTAPGHHVLVTRAALESRWYDWFPLDFAAEFLWPGTIDDLQEFSYTLEPYAVPLDRPLTEEELAALRVKLDELGARAEEHRRAGAQDPGAEDSSAPGGPDAVPATVPPPEDPPGPPAEPPRK